MASISTPVFPSQRTMACTSIVPWSRSRSNVMSTELMATGCASGISDGVCFAARTPAIFAVVNTSPFGRACSMSFCSVSGRMRTLATATASRWVLRLAPTSTMDMPPVSSKWEKSFVMSASSSQLVVGSWVVGSWCTVGDRVAAAITLTTSSITTGYRLSAISRLPTVDYRRPLLWSIDVPQRLATEAGSQLLLLDYFAIDLGGQTAEVEPSAGDAHRQPRSEGRAIVAGAEHLQTPVPARDDQRRAQGFGPFGQIAKDLSREQRAVDGHDDATSGRILERAEHTQHPRLP